MKIVNEKEFNELYGKGLVLVDFFATWCGPCKMLTPVLEEVSEEMKDDVTIVKVDVDQESNLAGKFGVMSIPTLILFKDGEIINKTLGFQPKPAIKEFIKKGL